MAFKGKKTGGKGQVIAVGHDFNDLAPTPSPIPTPPAPPTPIINSFGVNNANLAYGGGSVVLTWSTSNVTTVSIDNGVGTVSVNSSAIVNVTESTTFNLSATGPGGTAYASVSVSVAPPPPLPTVTSFSASQTTLSASGGSVTLTWTSSNATSATMDQSVGAVAVNGSTVVSVTSTKTFTLTVSNVTGSTQATVTITVLPAVPAITSFTALPATLPFGGGSVTLTWTTSNVSSVSIDQGVGSVVVNGSTSISITDSTTFNLTATGPGGTVYASASVTVNSVPPPPPLPTISSFTATPSTFAAGGGTTTFNWTSSNATSASIDHSVGSVSVNGSTTASVTTTTTYTLTVTNITGSTQASVTVTVSPPIPSITSFTALPSTLPFGGGTVTLTWTTSNITSVTIDNGVGSVATNGNTTKAITTSTTFNLTATGPGGTVFASASVTVSPPPPLPVATSFTATPSTLAFGGGNVTLAWTSTNATSASIDQGVGSVAVNSSTVVNTTTSRTYTLTVSNVTGSTTRSTSVVVSPPLPLINSFTANPTSLGFGGGNVTLSWSTSNAVNVSINNGIGTVAASGSMVVNITTSTGYILTATGAGTGIDNTITRSVSITVASIPAFTPYADVNLPALEADRFCFFLETMHFGLSNAWYHTFVIGDNVGFNSQFPDLNHMVWKTKMIAPEIRINTYSWGYAVGDPGTAWRDEVLFVKQKFEEANCPFERYTLNCYPFMQGPGGFQGNPKNTYPLADHPDDLLPSDGRAAGGAQDGNFLGATNQVTPYRINAINAFRNTFITDFPIIRQQFDLAGLTGPNAPRLEAIVSTQEHFGRNSDFAPDTPNVPTVIWTNPDSVDFNRQGWVTRSLASPLSNSNLFDGSQTFTNFCNTVTLRNGAPVPPPRWDRWQGRGGAMAEFEGVDQFIFITPYREAFWAATTHAFYKGYVEPFFMAFDSAFPNLKHYAYQVYGTGSSLGGITILPGGDPVYTKTQGTFPYRLRGHGIDWYGEGLGGPCFTWRQFYDGNIWTLVSGDTTNSYANTTFHWIKYILLTWPNPHTDPFNDNRNLAAAYNYPQIPEPYKTNWTVGDYHWCQAVRFILAIYELRIAYPNDGICPWMTLYYLRDQTSWKTFKWVIHRMRAMGVRRAYLWDNFFTINDYCGAGLKKDLLLELFKEIKPDWATAGW